MRTMVKQWIWPTLLGLGVAAGVYLVSTRAVDPELKRRNADLEANLAAVRAENDRLAHESATLRAELIRLRERPTEQLHHARTQLGMVKPGEVVYQLKAREDDRR